MDIDNQRILIIIVVITLLSFPIVAFTTGALNIASCLLFTLFLSGCTLLSALFPKRDKLGGLERLTPSFGFILNYTPWGIKLCPILDINLPKWQGTV